MNKKVLTIAAIVGLVFICGLCGLGTFFADGDSNFGNIGENVTQNDNSYVKDTGDEPQYEPEPADQNEKPSDLDIPSEYKSALAKADLYSNTQYMSKQGLYDQLVSEYGENFTPEAAQYAIDNVDANWDENALIKAGSYSNSQHMSKRGLYEQLISEYGEQFTEPEAQYAIDNVTADWNANALAKAISYRDNMNMSPASIKEQLVSEYGEQFTQEEADYAIENLD